MNDTKQREHKKGIALVMVLGFLAILTLMAVGFAISMRTEHLVSRAHLESVSARQLAATALARALDDIESTVSTNYYPDFFDDSGYSNLLYAIGTDTADLPDITTLTNYLPGALHDELLLADEAEVVGWQTITNSQNETIGQITYVVANCSGFLDASQLMQTNRYNGMTVGEIEPLTGSDYDFSSTTTASNFFNSVRTNWVQLVNQGELVNAYSSYDNDKTMPDYLFPFSYAPADTNTIPVVLDQTDDGIYYYIDSDGNPASVTLADAAANDQPDWVDAYAAGTDIDGTILPERVRTNLGEMISESGAHDNVGSSSESAALNSTNLWGSSYLMCDMLARYNIGSEVVGAGSVADGITWYRWNEWTGLVAVNKGFFARVFPVNLPAPFLSEIWGEVVESDDGSYEVTFEFEFVNLFNEPIDLSDYRLHWDVEGVQDACPYEWSSSEVASLTSGTITFGKTGNDAPTFVTANGGTSTLEPGAVLRMSCLLTSDSLANNTYLRLVEMGSSSGDSTLMYLRNDQIGDDDLWYLEKSGGSLRSFKLSAYDPRVFQSGITTDTSRYHGQSYIEGTGGDTFDAASISDEFPADDAIAALGDAASTPDGTFQMYYPESVDADYPVFDSLAHIGHQVLRQDMAFSTIPLVGTNAADVATYFSLTNTWPETTGRININTPYPAVLASGFMSAEVLRTNTVSQTTTNLLSQANALELAELIIENRPEGGYTNVVSALRCASVSDFKEAAGDVDKFQVEEIVARSMRLFTTRQQLFTIYVTAQSLVNEQVASESQAVAVIWRDPVADDDGNHAVKVLAFSYLTD
jgi:hypothetical protein